MLRELQLEVLPWLYIAAQSATSKPVHTRNLPSKARGRAADRVLGTQGL